MYIRTLYAIVEPCKELLWVLFLVACELQAPSVGVLYRNGFAGELPLLALSSVLALNTLEGLSRRLCLVPRRLPADAACRQRSS